MDLKPGSRWRSSVCDTEVVVVKPPKGEARLECGGHPMVPMAQAKPEGLSLSPDHAQGSQVGKRYIDEESGAELLCSKAGAGSLALNGRPVAIKDAKKLPSSD
jgi:hypothetical protein